MLRLIAITLLVFISASPAQAQEKLVRKDWPVGDQKREALVFAPEKAKTEKMPLVFVFHGHGGTMQNASRSFHLQTLWPEAIVVYPQGLNTPGLLTDKEGKRAGWQPAKGAQNDRDLQFFDTMLESLKKEFQVDENRIYSTGHSNGGGFTYLLWAERGDVFAAVAPSAAAGFRQRLQLKPKPVLHIAGEKDELVKFEWQKIMIERLKQLNGVSGEGKPWPGGKLSQIFKSDNGPPVVVQIHPGGHQFNREASEAIVAFFKENARSAKSK